MTRTLLSAREWAAEVAANIEPSPVVGPPVSSNIEAAEGAVANVDVDPPTVVVCNDAMAEVVVANVETPTADSLLPSALLSSSGEMIGAETDDFLPSCLGVFSVMDCHKHVGAINHSNLRGY